jgi:hypothetical protein
MAFLLGLAIGCGGVIGAALFGQFKVRVKIVLIVASAGSLIWILLEVLNYV